MLTCEAALLLFIIRQIICSFERLCVQLCKYNFFLKLFVSFTIEALNKPEKTQNKRMSGSIEVVSLIMEQKMLFLKSSVSLSSSKVNDVLPMGCQIRNRIYFLISFELFKKLEPEYFDPCISVALSLIFT
jgi:hypothetical protein